jgi:hypothetical protein
MSTYLEFHHSVHYTTKPFTQLHTVAESLVGLERLVLLVPDVLEGTPIGAGPIGIEVYISSVTTGSLTNNVLMRYIFGNEKTLEAWVKRVRDVTGVNTMNKAFPIAGPIIAGMAVLGGLYAINKMIGKDSTVPGTVTNLTNCQNVILLQGSNTLNITPDAFATVLRTRSGNIFNLASNTCRTLGPAKIGGGAVSIDESSDLTLSAEAVREVPQHIERSRELPLVQVFEKESVELRAMDIDNRTKGWAIVVPRITGKRLKVELDPSLDPSNIAFHSTLLADVELFYRENDEGERVYVAAFLRKVHPQNASQP